jgi:AAA family ATP:ADP antiporter
VDYPECYSNPLQDVVVNRIFSSFFDIRKGEYLLSLLMVSYYYLVLVTYYFLKPARDSLFLVKLGASQLPIVFILIAVVVVPVTTMYARASRSLKLNRMIMWTTGVMIAALICMRLLLNLEQSWVFYLFYIFVSIYGALMTSQAWLLANAAFDATQAKRIFALIGLGGILGASTGGEVTNLIVSKFNVQTEDLLFICIGVLIASAVLAHMIWALRQKNFGSHPQARAAARQKQERKESIADLFKMIKRSRHLVYIITIIAIMMMVASLVDFQFKSVSAEAFPTKEELTSFLGKFYSRLSLVSLFLQFLFANQIMRLLGVGGAILFLPFGLLLGSVTMFLVPGLFAGILLRGADGTFRYSIDKTGRELLFMPVPLEIKKRTKLFIDMFIDRWFRGIAGALLLLLTLVLHFSARQISIVVIVLVLAWIVVALLAKREYVNAFRSALERRAINLDELQINPSDASTIKLLISTLKSDNERQVNYALEMLISVQDKSLVAAVTPLLSHSSAEVRINSIKILRKQRDGDLHAVLAPLVGDPDPEVRLQAIQGVCAHFPEGPDEALKTFLQNSDSRIQASAVVCAAEQNKFTEQHLDDSEVIKKLMSVEGEDREICRIQVARALASLEALPLRSTLVELLNDSSPRVVIQAIKSAGLTQGTEFIPHLLDKLDDRRYRSYSRSALAAYGYLILATLSGYMTDRRVPVRLRQYAPLIMKEIPLQQSVDALTASLKEVDTQVKHQVVRALNKLRTCYPDLEFREDKITTALLEETRSYYEIIQILHLHRQSGDNPRAKLLQRALEEKLDRNLERIFRLLALRYSPNDIHNAYEGIVSSRKDLRANAVEFLDNLLGKDLKRYIQPILDPVSIDLTLRKGRDLFKISIQNCELSLQMLIQGDDLWLKACAIYMAGSIDPMPEECRALIQAAAKDSDSLVRETAALVLKQTSGS